jgi:hypothetical protein
MAMEVSFAAGLVRPFSKYAGYLGGTPDSQNSCDPEISLKPGVSSHDLVAKKGMLPVHVTLVHKFDGVTFTARHPNSQNTTRSAQLEHPERSDEIFLYVVYHNVPNDPNHIGSAIHDGCNELKFGNDGATLSATTKWSLQGKYWTDKPRAGSSLNDRGTWGQFNVHWESPGTDEASPDWTDQQRFFPK